MSKIKLSDSTFTVCPEGEHYFKITKVEHDENFGTIKITLKTPDGYIDNEQYQLVDGSGEVNEGAVGAFSYLAKCAMNDQTLTEIDPLSLKNHYIKATVSHEKRESRTKPGKMLTFSNISDIAAASEEEWNAGVSTKAAAPSAPAATVATPPKKAAGFDLDALFGKK